VTIDTIAPRWRPWQNYVIAMGEQKTNYIYDDH
jgi:hypothetical protein